MAINNTLTLGPHLFNWPAAKKLDFYKMIANEADVDVVYVGEVICQKRFACWGDIYDEIVTELLSSGKKVIISSLALINTAKELEKIHQYLKNPAVIVEANDVSVLNIIGNNDFCIGPYVNIYNEDTLSFYANLGAKHVTLSPELPKDSIRILTKNKQLEFEYTIFGRLPLAISARCAHARIYQQQKSNCRYVCEKDLNGLPVTTLDQQPFLTINGLQTMSYTYCNMVNEIDELLSMGVSRFRVSPQTGNILDTLACYRRVIQQEISAEEGANILSSLYQDADFSNGFYHNTSGYKMFKNQQFGSHQ